MGADLNEGFDTFIEKKGMPYDNDKDKLLEIIEDLVLELLSRVLLQRQFNIVTPLLFSPFQIWARRVLGTFLVVLEIRIFCFKIFILW